MDTRTAPAPAATAPSVPAPSPDAGRRDRFIDAVRAGALLVVVFGHWLATLPRVVDGTTVANDHLLHVWQPAGLLTWVLQVVPVFVLVSAAATPVPQRDEWLGWWSSRAQRLARPTLTYLAALAAVWGVALLQEPVGAFAQLFSGSLTVHLWFVVMLLLVQAALPLSAWADRRFGLRAVVALVATVLVVDALRLLGAAPSGEGLGAAVATAAPGIGWLNVLAVWLVPQQLGLAWRAGRLRGRRVGAALLLAGAAWAWVATSLGYPVAMVGADPTTGASNVLPPTAALLGPIAIQAGLVLLAEHPVRAWLADRRRWQVVATLSAIGMPLYLWHKLAELPAVWLANRAGLVLDRGLPGDPGFWTGRLLWLGLCTLTVLPLLAAVVWWERRRRPTVPASPRPWRQLTGGVAVVAAATIALDGGLDLALVAFAVLGTGSALLRTSSARAAG